MTELDLSAYDPLVTRHAFTGFLRQQVFAELAHGRPGHCDLAAGTLTVAGVGTFAVDVLGTFSEAGRTFLWSWANPGAWDWAAEGLAYANNLRQLGQQHPGLSAFTEPQLAGSWVDPQELAYVCGERVGGRPLYILQSGSNRVYLLVHLDVPGVLTSFPPETWHHRIFEFYGRTSGDQRATIERGLEKSELQVSSTPAQTVARAADGTTLVLDWKGSRLSDARLRVS